MRLFRRKREADRVNPDERAPRTGVKYKDLLVLEQLVKAGADLTQPRHALHYLYFGSRDAAEAAAVETAAHGFEPSVSEPLPEYPDQWSLICERHGIVLELPTVRDHTDLLDGIAQRHGGEYDGWEASV